jgi:hypothetical protein
MTMVLGSAGTDLLQQLAGQVAGTGGAKSAFWGEMITTSLPRTVVGPIADRIKKTFVKKFAVAQGGNVVGRLLPFGIGAAIGGGGNHLLGRQIVRTAREGFGAPPAAFPTTLDPVVKAPRAVRERRLPLPRRKPKAIAPTDPTID